MSSYLFKAFTLLLSLLHLQIFKKIWSIIRCCRFCTYIYLKISRWINWLGIFSNGMFSKLKENSFKSGRFICLSLNNVQQNHKHFQMVFTCPLRSAFQSMTSSYPQDAIGTSSQVKILARIPPVFKVSLPTISSAVFFYK